jgi:choline dehydrogenase-like flavoprotein
MSTKLSTGAGIQFTETMRGFVSSGAGDDFKDACARGRDAGTILEFTVTVTVPDVDRMVNSPGHEGTITGTVNAPSLWDVPATVENGRFQLFVRDPDQPLGRKMIYRLPLTTADGARYLLDAWKSVKDEAGPDLWSDTTTAFFILRRGHDIEGEEVGRGIVRIAIADFAKQLTTMRGTNAANKLAEMRALAKFGAFFAGSLNDVYGGIFARASAFLPDAPPRRRRELRCGTPQVHYFDTTDGVQLRMLRFEGGSKGPVILAPGFGTAAEAFTLDTTATNLPEYLHEAGYDVWVLDYRASPALPSASTQFTVDEVACHDYPAAVARVLDTSGADSVQIVAHCVGAMAWLMAQAAGLQGVRSGVASQLGLHPRVATLNKVRAGTAAGSFLSAMGIETLSTELAGSGDWKQRMYDHVLRLYPSDHTRCNSPVCRRILFMYGEVFDHDQLNEATHDAVHEVFGVANLSTLNHISAMLRKGHVIRADGVDAYLPHAERLKLPIAFLHGANNRMFLREGTELTVKYLSEANGAEHYALHVVPGYAHMDCFIGRNAVRDVYPLVRAELDRYNA